MSATDYAVFILAGLCYIIAIIGAFVIKECPRRVLGMDCLGKGKCDHSYATVREAYRIRRGE